MSFFGGSGSSSGSFFGGSGSSSGSFFGGGGGGSHGVLGFIENLGSDIVNMAKGLPSGLVMLAEHPLRTAKAVGVSMWHDWSPLFHGNVGQFAHQSFDHPLAPLLDVASVASLGATAASLAAAPFTGGASLGEVAGEAGMLAGRAAIADSSSALAKVVKAVADLRKPGQLEIHTPQAFTIDGRTFGGAGQFTKELAPWTKPVGRLTQIGLTKISDQIAPLLPRWFGNDARYMRELDKKIAWNGLAKSHLMAKSQDAVAQVAAKAQLGKFVDAAHLLDQHNLPLEQALLDWNHTNVVRHALAMPVPETGIIPRGWNVLLKDAPKRDTRLSFEQELANFGAKVTMRGRNVTGRLDRVARQADGQILVVPSKALNAAFRDGAGSAGFLKILAKPTSVWKHVLIGWSPRSFANVSVGNTFMTMADQLGAHFVPAMVDAFRATKGDKAAFRSLAEVGGAQPSVFMRHFSNILNSSFAKATLGEPGAQESRLAKIAKTGPTYTAMHKVEQGLKRLVITNELRHAPEVRMELRGMGHAFPALTSGKHFWTAADRALEKNPALRQRISDHALATVGDYQTLSKTERKVAALIPFYTWDRHIARHIRHMVAEHPVRVDALGRLGQEGTNSNQQVLGDLPSFLKDATPMSLLGLNGTAASGRANVLNFAGLNPYSSLADLADAARAAVVGGHVSPGDTIGGQINPFLTGLFQAVSGTDMLTGAPLKTHGGVLPTMLTNFVTGIPQVRLLQTAIEGQPQTKKPPLYDNSLRNLLIDYLGVPYKAVDLSKAHEMAAKAEGKKKSATTSFFG